ncbi:WAP four-disulfide core domain protein 8-like [Saccostrea cucullata]|uniref:WAP four-disulfide core domain protein 8-like n=1 Tax=Saccostrea cuccullata TaxID=36930 RepID=UPI002ED3F2BE
MLRFLVLFTLLSLVLSQRINQSYSTVRDRRFLQVPSILSQSAVTRNDFRFDKVGECPRSALKRPCFNELWFTFCFSDYDCLGHQKCCMYGCGRERRCMEAINVPHGCKYNGIKYEETSVFPSKDGCNECVCDRGQVQCTQRKCLSCLYNGIWYTPQYNFRAADDCNICRCLPTGKVECTQETCKRKDCAYNGQRYIVGQTFPKGDNCNTCFCHNKGIRCSEISCDRKRCDLPLERGSCRARLPRWYYNVKLGKCEMFEYSGCEGNNNNFLTLKDCVEQCEF